MSQKSEKERRQGCDWFWKRIKDKIDKGMEAKQRERRIKAEVEYRYEMKGGFFNIIDFGLKFFSGARRMGFLAGKYAFKFPTITSFVGMIAGFREQQQERYWWCSESGVHPWGQPYLNEILWADRFGFFQISRRCAPVLDELRFEHDLAVMENMFKVSTIGGLGDQHIDNFGYTRDGRLVYLDYGFFNGMGDCYLGCPNGFSLIRTLNRIVFFAHKKLRAAIGDEYQIRMQRVENERNVSEGLRTYDSLWAPSMEAVRLELQAHCQLPGYRATAKRVALARDATHATQCITLRTGRTHTADAMQFWKVTQVIGEASSAEVDVTGAEAKDRASSVVFVQRTPLAINADMPDIRVFAHLTDDVISRDRVTEFLAQHGFPLGRRTDDGLKFITSHLGDMKEIRYGSYVGIDASSNSPELFVVNASFDIFYEASELENNHG